MLDELNELDIWDELNELDELDEIGELDELHDLDDHRCISVQAVAPSILFRLAGRQKW